MSDVGRGSISAGPAAAVGDTGSVLGIDISDCLGEEWKKRLPETNESNLEFRVADIYKTDLEVDQFDVIYVHQLLQHLSDPIGALRAATRLTKPGGLVSVREVGWGTFAAYPDLESLREFRRIYDEVATRNGGNSRTGPACSGVDADDGHARGYSGQYEHLDVL